MKHSMLFRVLGSLLLATFAGYLTGPDTAIFGLPLLKVYGLGGKLFLNALTLVVVPLVCSSIITGTARMGADSAFKELGKKTCACFVGMTFLAVLVGYLLTVTLQPGVSQESELIPTFIESTQLQQLGSQTESGGFEKLEQLFLRLVPTNILAAAAQGQMIGLIVFCMFFGYFLTKIDEKSSTVILSFFQGVLETMMKITHLIMKALPFGVFFLVAKVIGETGFDSIYSVASFFFVVLIGLAIEAFVVLPILLKLTAGINPLAFFKAMTPALMTAFSTSSSAATMPVTLDCLEKSGIVPPKISAFTIPLGTSINLPGTALHVCCSVFFIAQVYNVPLSFSEQGVTLLVILLTSFGIAGVPSASLFAIGTVLAMVGLPAEGLALILAVERLIDMCRTSVNVFGNSCASAIIANAGKDAETDLSFARTNS